MRVDSDRMTERRVARSLVRQLDESDCGVACLAWVVRYFGGYESLERLRALSGTTAEGATLLGIHQAAEAVGLISHPYGGTVQDLAGLDSPAILHVILDGRRPHFVVTFGRDADGLYVVGDPGIGVLRRTTAELQAMWESGALLQLQKSDRFSTRKARTRGKRQWLLEAVRMDAKPLLLSVLLGLVVSAFSLATAAFSKSLIDDILPNRELHKLTVGLALLLLILLAQVAMGAARQLLLLRQGRSFNVRLTTRFVDELIRLPFAFFGTRKTGDLIARLNDAERLQQLVTYVLGGVVVNVLMLVAGLGFLAVQSAKIALFVAGVTSVFAFVTRRFHGRIIERQHRVMAAHSLNKSGYVEAIQGIEAIKSSSAESLFTRLMRETYRVLQDEVFELGLLAVSFSAVLELIGTIGFVGALAWSSMLVLDGSTGAGSLVAVLQMLGMIVPSARSLAASNMEFQEASVAFDRIYQLTSLEPEFDGEEQKNLSGVSKVRRLQMDGITFRYPGRPALLDGVSLECARGELVLVVGRTGAGKSSLLRILQRLEIPETGMVRINGCEWKDVSIIAWRAVLGVVPQRVRIFSGTLLDNIVLGRAVAPDTAIRVCTDLGLSAFFAELPAGFNTPIGEGGVVLSGGQRQLVGLARALVRRPQVLLLDEPTAAMDEDTSEFVMDLIESYRPQAATLVVSHAGALRSRADRIYRLAGGKLELDLGRPDRIAIRSTGTVPRVNMPLQGARGRSGEL